MNCKCGFEFPLQQLPYPELCPECKKKTKAEKAKKFRRRLKDLEVENSQLKVKIAQAGVVLAKPTEKVAMAQRIMAGQCPCCGQNLN